MRVIIIFALLLTSFYKLPAQDDSAIIVNSLKEGKEQVTRKFFKYTEYTAGKVVFNDGGNAEARMNYNRFSGDMFFINPKSDTLILARPETFNLIIVGIDTFYFFEKNYLEKITHYPAGNLALNQTVRLIGKEKKGAYGIYSGASSVNSSSSFTNDNQITTYLGVDENAVFKLNNVYFLSDKFNNFFPANKKNFYKVFFVHEKEIKSFVDAHHTNFNKQAHLEQLLQYIHGLN